MKYLSLVTFALATLVAYSSSFGTQTSEPVVIKIVAKKYEFNPAKITVKAGTPVVFELTTSDRVHGFSIPDLKLHAEIKPGETTRLQFTPDKPGSYPFKCDVYCGSGHPNTKGVLIVTE